MFSLDGFHCGVSILGFVIVLGTGRGTICLSCCSFSQIPRTVPHHTIRSNEDSIYWWTFRQHCSILVFQHTHRDSIKECPCQYVQSIMVREWPGRCSAQPVCSIQYRKNFKHCSKPCVRLQKTHDVRVPKDGNALFLPWHIRIVAVCLPFSLTMYLFIRIFSRVPRVSEMPFAHAKYPMPVPVLWILVNG